MRGHRQVAVAPEAKIIGHAQFDAIVAVDADARHEDAADAAFLRSVASATGKGPLKFLARDQKEGGNEADSS